MAAPDRTVTLPQLGQTKQPEGTIGTRRNQLTELGPDTPLQAFRPGAGQHTLTPLIAVSSVSDAASIHQQDAFTGNGTIQNNQVHGGIHIGATFGSVQSAYPAGVLDSTPSNAILEKFPGDYVGPYFEEGKGGTTEKKEEPPCTCSISWKWTGAAQITTDPVSVGLSAVVTWKGAQCQGTCFLDGSVVVIHEGGTDTNGITPLPIAIGSDPVPIDINGPLKRRDRKVGDRVIIYLNIYCYSRGKAVCTGHASISFVIGDAAPGTSTEAPAQAPGTEAGSGEKPPGTSGGAAPAVSDCSCKIKEIKVNTTDTTDGNGAPIKISNAFVTIEFEAECAECNLGGTIRLIRNDMVASSMALAPSSFTKPDSNIKPPQGATSTLPNVRPNFGGLEPLQPGDKIIGTAYVYCKDRKGNICTSVKDFTV